MALRQVILTVLSHGDKTGYEITRQFDTVLVYFWKASHQQVYRELAKLLDDGCVAVEEIAQQGKPDKKIYHLTRTGKKELKAWLLAPTAYDPPKLDLLVKLLAAPMAGPLTMQSLFADNATVIAAQMRQFREMEAVCQAVPIGKRGELHDLLYLALRRGLLLGAAHQKWLREVAAYFAGLKE